MCKHNVCQEKQAEKSISGPIKLRKVIAYEQAKKILFNSKPQKISS